MEPHINYHKIVDQYYATDEGLIWSEKRQRFLKPYVDKRGYWRAKLSVKGKTKTHLWHRLIALAFLGESNLTVDHINNIKTDNSIKNLRYISAKDNHEKASTDGAIKKGLSHYSSKFSRQDILHIRNSTLTHSKLALFYKTGQATISRIKQRKTYSDV